MKIAHSICCGLLIAIGAIHIAFSATFDNLTENVAWFIAAGLSIIFLGFLNILFKKHNKELLTYRLTQLANLLMLALLILLNWVSPMVPGFILFGAVLVLSGLTFKMHRS